MYRLKITWLITTAVMQFGLSSCKKNRSETLSPTDQSGMLQGFTKYVIPQGEQSATTNPVVAINISELPFAVYFDSSAIYQLQGIDQLDINKLTGFADNGLHHLQYSARFGWRWSDNRLRLFGYVHNNGIIQLKEISAIEIGKIYNCSIKVMDSTYVFKISELKKSATLPREATSPTAAGYRLYPYFGGNQVAPHEIRIWIKYL